MITTDHFRGILQGLGKKYFCRGNQYFFCSKLCMVEVHWKSWTLSFNRIEDVEFLSWLLLQIQSLISTRENKCTETIDRINAEGFKFKFIESMGLYIKSHEGANVPIHTMIILINELLSKDVDNKQLILSETDGSDEEVSPRSGNESLDIVVDSESESDESNSESLYLST